MKTPSKVLPSPSHLLRFLALGIVVFAAALATGWIWYFVRGNTSGRAVNTLEGLQVFGTVPDFSLIERDNRKVTRADLLGTVWVANFIYTHCTDTCPLQSARMAALQRDFPGQQDLRFLSITVDPRRDTPAVLTQYAAGYDADRTRWWFLTGDKPAIYALIQEGFRLSVEDPTDSAAPAVASPAQRGSLRDFPRSFAVGLPDTLEYAMSRWLTPSLALAHSDSEFLAPPFLHSSWFVLGDRQARMRGYYKTEDDAAMKRLRGDIRLLLQER
jgi:cytochrome oxidase Cu insertion factor (SCO1/SenC/PrrC family)